MNTRHRHRCCRRMPPRAQLLNRRGRGRPGEPVADSAVPGPSGGHRCRRWARRGRLLAASGLWSGGFMVSSVFVPGSSQASALLAAATSLDEVITNLRHVIMGLLVGLATLFATIGGVRYILAGGDPGEVEAAKKTLRYAAIGYAIAVLAPMLVKLLQHIVGTP